MEQECDSIALTNNNKTATTLRLHRLRIYSPLYARCFYCHAMVVCLGWVVALLDRILTDEFGDYGTYMPIHL